MYIRTSASNLSKTLRPAGRQTVGLSCGELNGGAMLAYTRLFRPSREAVCTLAFGPYLTQIRNQHGKYSRRLVALHVGHWLRATADVVRYGVYAGASVHLSHALVYVTDM